MKDCILTVKENISVAPKVYKMTLSGDVSGFSGPGQFLNIRLEGLYLRRPVSVFDISGDSVTIIYKIVGQGTEILSGYGPGVSLDVLTGLGNGYDLSLSGDNPLLIGGGVGIPPLYYLAKQLVKKCPKVSVRLGFNTESELFCLEDFKKLGCDVSVSTVDGTYGKKGFVTDILPEKYSYFYTCGPEPMLKSVYKNTVTEGQFSFEERMGCGFGACMGCSCKTVTGYKRICKDGPVLKKEEILWKD